MDGVKNSTIDFSNVQSNFQSTAQVLKKETLSENNNSDKKLDTTPIKKDSLELKNRDTSKPISMSVSATAIKLFETNDKNQEKINHSTINGVMNKQNSSELKFKDSSEPIKIKNLAGMTVKEFDSSIIKEPNQGKTNHVGVNGIMNKKDYAGETFSKMSKVQGNEIKLVYNESHKIVADSIESVGGMLDSTIIKSVAKIANKLDSESKNHITLSSIAKGDFRKVAEALQEKGPEVILADEIYHKVKNGESYEINAHSQGAAITADALNIVRDRLYENTKNLKETEMKMSNITVLTIGGFATRKDFPNEVKIKMMANNIYSEKGLDPVSVIADQDAEMLPSVGDIKFKSKVVIDHIEQDPNRSKLEKAYLKGVINTSVVATTSAIKVERGILALKNLTAVGLVKTSELFRGKTNVIEILKGNSDPMVAHGAQTGYLDQNEAIDKEIKNISN